VHRSSDMIFAGGLKFGEFGHTRYGRMHGQETGVCRSFSRREPEMGNRYQHTHKEDIDHAGHKEEWTIPTGFQQRK